MNNLNLKTLLTMSLIVGALALVACGGDSSGDDSAQAASEPTAGTMPGGGGPMAGLSEEEIQCLEEQGVTLPEAPTGAEQGSPGEMPQGGPPQGTAEDMEAMQAAMSECGIEMPTPPEGAPSGQDPSGAAPSADTPAIETQGT